MLPMILALMIAGGTLATEEINAHEVTYCQAQDAYKFYINLDRPLDFSKDEYGRMATGVVWRVGFDVDVSVGRIRVTGAADPFTAELRDYSGILIATAPILIFDYGQSGAMQLEMPAAVFQTGATRQLYYRVDLYIYGGAPGSEGESGWSYPGNGCTTVSVEMVTWGQIKARYR